MMADVTPVVNDMGEEEVDFLNLLLSIKEGVEHEDVEAFKQLIQLIQVNNQIPDSELTKDINDMINTIQFSKQKEEDGVQHNNSYSKNAETKELYPLLISSKLLPLF